MFDQMAKDLIYSARGLVRERAFALTTIATLTVALALVTVVFAIFNAYVLRPYVVRDPYSLCNNSMDRAKRKWRIGRTHVPLERLPGPATPDGSVRRRDR